MVARTSNVNELRHVQILFQSLCILVDHLRMEMGFTGPIELKNTMACVSRLTKSLKATFWFIFKSGNFVLMSFCIEIILFVYTYQGQDCRDYFVSSPLHYLLGNYLSLLCNNLINDALQNSCSVHANQTRSTAWFCRGRWNLTINRPPSIINYALWLGTLFWEK